MPLSKSTIFQTIFENSPDAVIVADADRTMMAVNPAFTELFGYSAEEVVGRCGSMLYVDRAEFEEQGRIRYNPAPLTTDPTYIIRYRKKNGEIFWAEVRGKLVLGDDGVMHGYVALVRDIDRQVRLKDLLRAVIALSSVHDAEVDTVIRDFLGIGCTYFDLEIGVVTRMADGTANVEFALDPGGTIREGRGYPQHMTFCDKVVRTDRVQTLCCAGRQGAADHPAYRTLGLESYIGAPLRCDGADYGTLAFAGREARCGRFSEEDETLIRLLAGWVGGLLGQRASGLEREALSERLAQSARRFEWLYRQTPAMLHSIDSSGRLIEVSDFWLDEMGYESREEVIGRRSIEFLTEPSRAFAEADILPAFWQTGMVKDVPYEFVRKDGSTFEAELSAILNRDETEKGQSLAVIYDVTERNCALRELETRNAELRQLNVELERFASAASHDLQEPLRKIQTFSRYLEDDVAGKLSGDGTYALGVMRDAAGRMRQLISDLLAYSHAAHSELDMEPVDLNVLLVKILDDLEVQVEESGARVRVQALPEVRCDGILVRQLFQNLLSNALKYRDRSRACQVQIGAVEDRHDDVWRIFVEDNGVGFDPDHAERIFMPFQRLHGRSSFSGSGFGLSICKRIVERHGWSIMAEAEPGRGATFAIVVPTRVAIAGVA